LWAELPKIHTHAFCADSGCGENQAQKHISQHNAMPFHFDSPLCVDEGEMIGNRLNGPAYPCPAWVLITAPFLLSYQHEMQVQRMPNVLHTGDFLYTQA